MKKIFIQICRNTKNCLPVVHFDPDDVLGLSHVHLEPREVLMFGRVPEVVLVLVPIQDLFGGVPVVEARSGGYHVSLVH